MDQNQNQMNQQHSSPEATPPAPPHKKKRNQRGTPNPDAEVIALSPKTIMETNRFICEVCKKGFQREQNLQLHRRGHNLPWKLKQKSVTKGPIRRKVYLCPEPTCIHHDPSRALGDLTGIKKHYYRKHGEKKWKCNKCSKNYAVQSDLKAHSKICGTREYTCDCGTVFSRRDSFITHRAFCDALAQETARKKPPSLSSGNHLYGTNDSNMALAISQVAPQMSNIQDQTNNSKFTDLLLHGDNLGSTEQFNRFLHSSLQAGLSSFKPSQQTMQHYSPSSFFMAAAENLNQNYSHNKNSPSPGLFNHPFLSTNSSNNSFSQLFNSSAIGSFGGGNEATNFYTTGNSIMGGHHQQQQIITSSAPSHLFSTSLQSNYSVANTHHMSATALLQKVAQMSATSSSSGSKAGHNRPLHVPAPHLSAIYSNSNMQYLMNNTFAASEDGGSLGLTGFEPYDDKSNKRKQPKLLHGVNIGGSDDRLTRDFLGVGEKVRSMSGGSGGVVSEREEHGNGGSGRNFQ